MKLQKAKRLCVNSGQICLITRPDSEWLSDGYSAWVAENMGLTKANVRAVMDIEDKKIGENMVREVDYSGRDYWSAYHDAGRDIPLEDKGRVLVDGTEYMVLVPMEGTSADMRPIYIDTAELAPIGGAGMVEYWLRRAETDVGNGLHMVAVLEKNELCVIGLISPAGRRDPEHEWVEGERKHGADRIEERIRELYALVGETTPEDMAFERRWSFMRESAQEREDDENA